MMPICSTPLPVLSASLWLAFFDFPNFPSHLARDRFVHVGDWLDSVQYCGYSVGEVFFYFGFFFLSALGNAKT
jgi:hypothetical protein